MKSTTTARKPALPTTKMEDPLSGPRCHEFLSKWTDAQRGYGLTTPAQEGKDLVPHKSARRGEASLSMQTTQMTWQRRPALVFSFSRVFFCAFVVALLMLLLVLLLPCSCRSSSVNIGSHGLGLRQKHFFCPGTRFIDSRHRLEVLAGMKLSRL